ncbi:MAG: hypothetical protein J5758_04065, partial [Abditibacteriota bacterium]|nr:hypothetical protein [Abditibacteriota bacterium]
MKHTLSMPVSARLLLPVFLLVCCVLQAAAADKTVFIRDLEKGKARTLVTYGTSLTETGGWVDMIRAKLAEKYGDNARVINGAKSAMWSGWGVDNLDERVLSHDPDLVILEFAVNDAFLEYNTDVAKS